jgi:hypothetical protein
MMLSKRRNPRRRSADTRRCAAAGAGGRGQRGADGRSARPSRNAHSQRSCRCRRDERFDRQSRIGESCTLSNRNRSPRSPHQCRYSTPLKSSPQPKAASA